MLKIGKDYVGAEEESKRLSIWEDNKRFVLKHNYEYDMGKHSFKVGLNKFADLVNIHLEIQGDV